MDTITIPKEKYEEMKEELEELREQKIERLRKRAEEFEENVKRGEVYTREDLDI